MAMTLQGKAKIRRVGNGFCLPLPTRDLKNEGIREGTEVTYVIRRPGRLNPAAFGSGHEYLKGVDLQSLMDEDRGTSDGDDRLP